MTGPRRRTWPGADLPGRRLFVAVSLPDHAVDELAAMVESVRAAGVPGGGRDVRWVRLDGLHITLRFLGPTLEDRVGAAAGAVRDAGAGVDPFEVVVGDAGAFPSIERPRALWLAIQSGADELAALAGRVGRSLATAGWDPDERPFRPHLTLARSDGVPAGGRIARRLVDAARGRRIAFRIEELSLFESITGGGPARYQPLEVVPLRPSTVAPMDGAG